jgi:hypothetical protein
MIIPMPHPTLRTARARRLSRLQARTPQQADWVMQATTADARRFMLLLVGVVVLLVIDLLHLWIAGGMLAGLTVLLLVWSIWVVWMRWRIHAMVDGLCERVVQQEWVQRDHDRMRRALEWHRLNLRVHECTTMTELVQLATERAMAISGGAATVEFPDSVQRDRLVAADERAFQIEIDGGGVLTVYRPSNEIDQAQRTTLEHLSLSIGLQAARLRGATQLVRQQAALMTLWEVMGMLRVAPDPQEAVRDACRRFAAALDLDWLALLAPDDRQALAVLLMARGRADGAAPRLSSAQVRVAAEALRTEHPLVRAEGDRSLVCLPIRFQGGIPLILAARGDIGDAAIHSLLMLFSEMVVERLARPAIDERAHVALYAPSPTQRTAYCAWHFAGETH